VSLPEGIQGIGQRWRAAGNECDERNEKTANSHNVASESACVPDAGSCKRFPFILGAIVLKSRFHAAKL